MRLNLKIAVLYTIVTTLIFGLAYPFAVTGIAQLLFKDKANGQLIWKNGHPTSSDEQPLGSRLIGQPFSGAGYFHSRPSAAGNGYDAGNSSGSNLAPTSKKLVDRITADSIVAQADHPGEAIPIDLVTASASGLDPDITPAAAEFQVRRISDARHVGEADIRRLVAQHTAPRQLGVLGEPRVNVLELNLDLDRTAPEVSR